MEFKPSLPGLALPFPILAVKVAALVHRDWPNTVTYPSAVSLPLLAAEL